MNKTLNRLFRLCLYNIGMRLLVQLSRYEDKLRQQRRRMWIPRHAR